MATKDSLGIRIKTFYEQVPKTRLVKKMPVIIRIVGKAFHTFTKGFRKPFDEIFARTMQETTLYLCKEIQGCVLGYTQSDEISLVLVDYFREESSAWLDYEVQKMCSISASMATMYFNKLFSEKVFAHFSKCPEGVSEQDASLPTEEKEYRDALEMALVQGATFDARVFNIPKEEVTNYFYWRQLDTSRNSIQMVGHAMFSHKELQNKSCSEIQEMLAEQKNLNWIELPTYQKWGSCVAKKGYSEPVSSESLRIIKTRWCIDKEIPVFKGEGREYIEQAITVGVIIVEE